MGTRRFPQAPVLVGAFVALLAVGLDAAAAAPVVVGSVKCLDCSPNDVNAEDAFKGLQVAIKCKSSADDTYETKALGPLDDTGVFSIPLAAELLRDDGALDRDCFAQLHTTPDTPCVGQAPPRIVPVGPSQEGATTSSGTTYLAAAADTVFSPVACKCGKFKKKHFMFGPPPPPPKPETPKPPTPTPTYGPPTPTPVPEPKPQPQPEPEPEPFFHKHPKMKFMHKKKPCPPLVDDDTTRPADGGQGKVPKKLN
ncbi:proline-rich protein 4-like [Phragmites australis]|uniref:proline-rich protein 4-like n=1 Tax=Phragmites australis TaxID=29695 RepID=UPI002D76C87B|nr:proline-rich protein 4-like [Phragmites australis]